MLLRFGVRVAGVEALARPFYPPEKARGAAAEADTAAAPKAREAHLLVSVLEAGRLVVTDQRAQVQFHTVLRKGPEQLCELLRRGGRRLPARIGWTCAGALRIGVRRVSGGDASQASARGFPLQKHTWRGFAARRFRGGNRFGWFQGTAALKTKPPRPFQETRLRPKGQKKRLDRFIGRASWSGCAAIQASAHVGGRGFHPFGLFRDGQW